jgi:hypothetical protein
VQEPLWSVLPVELRGRHVLWLRAARQPRAPGTTVDAVHDLQTRAQLVQVRVYEDLDGERDAVQSMVDRRAAASLPAAVAAAAVAGSASGATGAAPAAAPAATAAPVPEAAAGVAAATSTTSPEGAGTKPDAAAVDTHATVLRHVQQQLAAAQRRRFTAQAAAAVAERAVMMSLDPFYTATGGGGGGAGDDHSSNAMPTPATAAVDGAATRGMRPYRMMKDLPFRPVAVHQMQQCPLTKAKLFDWDYATSLLFFYEHAEAKQTPSPPSGQTKTL